MLLALEKIRLVIGIIEKLICGKIDYKAIKKREENPDDSHISLAFFRWSQMLWSRFNFFCLTTKIYFFSMY